MLSEPNLMSVPFPRQRIRSGDDVPTRTNRYIYKKKFETVLNECV